MLQRFCSLLLIFTVLVAPAFGEENPVKAPAVLHGKLLSLAGAGPVLRTQTKDYALAGRTSYLFRTLQDSRLANREVRLEGVARGDGSFEVEKLYTIRNGKLYQVRYYCEVCNIEALEPGNCVCCQQPTELQEIPVSETKK